MTDKLEPASLDPYGDLDYAVGSGDDFWCFAFHVHEDRSVTLHAVINAETGSFIQGAPGFPVRVPEADAISAARDAVFAALDWCCEGETPTRLDLKGWNQDPGFFVRSIRYALEGGRRPARRVKGWRARL